MITAGLVAFCFAMWRMDQMDKRHERDRDRIRSAILWRETGHYKNYVQDYKIYRIIETLGVTGEEAEELIVRYQRDSVRNEGN